MMKNAWRATQLEESRTKQIANESSKRVINQVTFKLNGTIQISKLALSTTRASTSLKRRSPTVTTTTPPPPTTTIAKLGSNFWSPGTKMTKSAAAAAPTAVPQRPSCITCTSLSPTLTALLRKFNQKDNANNSNKNNDKNNASQDMHHHKYNNATIMSRRKHKEQQLLRDENYHQQKYQSKPQQQQQPQQQHPRQQNPLSSQWLHTCFLFIVCVSLPPSTNMQSLPSALLSTTSKALLLPSSSQSQSQSSFYSASNNGDNRRNTTSSNSDVSPASSVSASFQQSLTYTQLMNDYHGSGRDSMHFVSSLEGDGNSGRLSGRILEGNDGGGGIVMDSVGTDRGGESNHIECPSFDETSACPCYKFEDGLFLECPGTTTMSLRTTLERITSPIHSLSIYDFDRSVTSLSPDVFQPGVNVRHLQFSHSHLETLKDNSLRNVRTSLESLSIVNGKLTQIPARALNAMQKLNSLDFDSNEIVKIDDYSFYGLRLAKLNVKGNKLQSIPEHSFVGLEEYMQEIDLSENRLRTFPMLALRKLDHLRTLRLSNNQISRFYGEIVANSTTIIPSLRLPSLVFLDLSSNKFTEISDDCFRAFPQLKTLSMYANQIEVVQPLAFKSLKELMSLDMSHNRIIALDSGLFAKNKRLQTIDLSHNHIHSIGGVFAGLPQLREVFLSENNILELPADAFTNSSNIDVIYLESNAIAHIDPNVFSTLVNLDHLYLRANFIPLMPVTLFDKCLKLTSLTLDNNEIQDLEIGVFRKLEYLREVRLHNNRIRRIRKGVFEPLPRLQELHVQKNNIEDIEPGAFRTLFNLQHINLQDNHLTILEDIFPTETGNASSLLSIQLESNYLSKVHVKTFQRQTHIQIMWLRDNSLNKVDKYLFMDLKELGRLYLSNNRIRDVERDTFSNLQQLRLLDLSVNLLKLIRREYFAELINLEELVLSRNEIEAIEGFSFNKLKKLKVLDLSHNPLVQLTRDIFMDDLAVTHLHLQNTSLHKIELHTFKSLQNLNELNFEQNFLSPADVQRLDVPSLRSLQLSHNNFSDADTSGMFDKLRSLQQLSMANCSLSAIPEELFIRNTNLVKLDLCDNWLTTMNRNIFNGLNVFKELRLCRNRLHEFPHIALYNLSTMEILDLSRNQLTSVDFFKLSGTPNLRQLKLSDNKISTLSGFNAVNLTQLDSVDLSGNTMLSLPANFLRHSINLQRVDLSSNRFLQIPSSALADVSLPRLSWLNLTGNPINRIYTVKEERYPHLKELYICQTNLSILTSKDFEAFQALQHLHLVNNRIMRISPGAFRSLINLLTLDIGINELEILPKERLQGLKLLRFLNISHNTLKDLEEFSSDLAQLQIIDLSYNQLDRISKKCFRNLDGLMELYLMGNRMTTLSPDAFRTLSRLNVLDLRKNYFELIPLDALKPLETNIKTLRLEDNPLHCSCDAQKLWEWLRDHRKWSINPAAPTTSDNINYLRCEHPAELRGKVFSQMDPQQFCDAPLIPKIAIQDIQPYSVIVSWQSREHLGLNGYEIVYHAVDGIEGDELQIRGKRLNGSANSAKLTKLMPNIRYHICVIGSGNWLTETVTNALQQIHFNDSSFLQPHDKPNNEMLLEDLPSSSPPMPQEEQYYEQYHSQLDNQPYTPHLQQALIENTIVTDNVLQSVLKNSHVSACTDVQTLDSTPSLITDENGLSSNGFIHGLLTRRLGLIVGCCLGIIVFIVMISVLSYVKLKKQRIENAKRQQSMPPEYISYRHFSIPNEELVRSGAVMSTVPSGISAHISGTSLNTNTTAVTTPIAGAALLKSVTGAGGAGASACAGAGRTIVIQDGAVSPSESITSAATCTADGANGCVNLTAPTVMPTANDVAGVTATTVPVSNTSNNHNNNAHRNHYHHHHNYLQLKQQLPKQHQQQEQHQQHQQQK